MTKSIPLALALLLPTMTLAHADGPRVRGISDPMTQQECSACHIAYPAAFLPASSWLAIMGDLPNHFGEDASLPEEQRAAIEAWLVANAADSSSRAMRGIDPANPPLRITELGWFTREHGHEVSVATMQRKAGSWSNCAGCHAGADKGYFGDD